MKHANAIRKGVFGLALAGLASTTIFTSAATAMAVFHDTHGKEITAERDVSDYSKIRIKGAMVMELTAGKDFSLTVEGDEDDVERLETYVRNGTLILDNADDGDDDNIHINSDGIKVTITMPTLEEFEVLGAVDAELNDINSDSLTIELKGAGSIEMEGTCGELDVELKGAGELDAEDLKCADVEVDVKGVGEAKVYASESVDADVSGIGSITVYGEPKKVRQSDSWLGKIRIK